MSDHVVDQIHPAAALGGVREQQVDRPAPPRLAVRRDAAGANQIDLGELRDTHQHRRPGRRVDRRDNDRRGVSVQRSRHHIGSVLVGSLIAVRETRTLHVLDELAGHPRIALRRMIVVGQSIQERVRRLGQGHFVFRCAPPRLPLRTKLLLEIPARAPVVGCGVVRVVHAVGPVRRIRRTPPLPIALVVVRADLDVDRHARQHRCELVEPARQADLVHFGRDLLAGSECAPLCGGPQPRETHCLIPTSLYSQLS